MMNEFVILWISNRFLRRANLPTAPSFDGAGRRSVAASARRLPHRGELTWHLLSQISRSTQ